MVCIPEPSCKEGEVVEEKKEGGGGDNVVKRYKLKSSQGRHLGIGHGPDIVAHFWKWHGTS